MLNGLDDGGKTFKAWDDWKLTNENFCRINSFSSRKNAKPEQSLRLVYDWWVIIMSHNYIILLSFSLACQQSQHNIFKTSRTKSNTLHYIFIATRSRKLEGMKSECWRRNVYDTIINSYIIPIMLAARIKTSYCAACRVLQASQRVFGV